LQSGIILDLGTGPGYLPIEIAKRSPAINIVGIDLTPKLIQMAQKNAIRVGLADRLNFQKGNAASLKFEDASFDMVISTGMLHSLKDPVKVFREIYRVLKKGGEAWIFDPAKISSQIDKKKWTASLTFREKFLLWIFKQLNLLEPIKTLNRKEVVALIENTDFKDCRIEEKTDEIRIKLKKL
jgi:ubiquinone/menaquinone biosynthesis C-methylase UbiE